MCLQPVHIPFKSHRIGQSSMTARYVEVLPSFSKQHYRPVSFADDVVDTRTGAMGFDVPCGKCEECLQSYRLAWADRMAKDWSTLVSASHTIGMQCRSYFVTLTYDNAHLPFIYDRNEKNRHEYLVDLQDDATIYAGEMIAKDINNEDIDPNDEESIARALSAYKAKYYRELIKRGVIPYAEYKEYRSTLEETCNLIHTRFIDMHGHVEEDKLMDSITFEKCPSSVSLDDDSRPRNTTASLRYEDVQKFLKRLRRYLVKHYTRVVTASDGSKMEYKPVLRYFLCGEYSKDSHWSAEKHGFTVGHRPHYHMLLWFSVDASKIYGYEERCDRLRGRKPLYDPIEKDGMQFLPYPNLSDANEFADLLKRVWQLGNVDASSCRSYDATTRYITKYVTKMKLDNELISKVSYKNPMFRKCSNCIGYNWCEENAVRVWDSFDGETPTKMVSALRKYMARLIENEFLVTNLGLQDDCSVYDDFEEKMRSFLSVDLYLAQKKQKDYDRKSDVERGADLYARIKYNSRRCREDLRSIDQHD